ncbi:ADP-ribosylation/Crystallin J1 [Kipferlia bialata]|uniref:ADP-ribosylation/Crystallin J1 n=1 Tax=Kipferlia bialata TaxID=797122 RepID=A0A9K3GHG8_9EUKA|nr:ADP-ribosylation/Crystallin J1 [Kipferlia bialata]|eukprot:g4036.t1
MDPATLRERAVHALRYSFLGDSLSMPVHWYYSVADIYKAFEGGVTKLESAPTLHPSSIMSLHSTAHGGREGTEGGTTEIVGDVILKGKRQYWGVANMHYHQGMKAGENTLNLQCARLVLREVAQGPYNPDTFLADYVAYMTADPPAYHDTYAESFHRGFFDNMQGGKDLHECGAATHDTASIGGLATIAPLALPSLLRGMSVVDVQRVCRTHLHLTHPSDTLYSVCDDYVSLISELLHIEEGIDPSTIVEAYLLSASPTATPAEWMKSAKDTEVVGGVYSPACYISDSWPSTLYLAYKYLHSTGPDSVKQGLLANANVGGDNCHRGAVLGVILGLCTVDTEADTLYSGLVEHDAIEKEIQTAIE